MSPSIKDLYPDKWITPADLPQEGQVLAVTRAAVERVYNTIDREYQPRLILSFHGIETRAVLNKTQCLDIANIVKDEDYTKWIGHQLKLVPGLARNKKPTIIFKQAPPPNTQKQTGIDVDPALLNAAMQGMKSGEQNE